MKQNNAPNLPFDLIIQTIIDQKENIKMVKNIERMYTTNSGGGIPPPKYRRTKYVMI